MAKNRVETRTDYEVEFQRRDGQLVAIIAVTSGADTYDGRGYAGSEVTGRQVLVVPMRSVHKLGDEITSALFYQATGDENERYDLDEDAKPRVGLYEPKLGTGAAGGYRQVGEFYTLAEARLAAQAFAGKGYTLRWLEDAESGDDMRVATSVIESV